MSRRLSYALFGACLAQGAAPGLLLLRLVWWGSLSRAWVTQEIANDLHTYVYLALSTTVVFSLFGGLLGRYADRLAQVAMTDPLTGLLNARAFQQRFREEMSRATRYRQPLSVLIVDLDDLKQLNDAFGHEAGDEALRRVATAIRHGLREADLGARIGGDEFTVLAPNTNEAAAVALGERLRTLVVEGHPLAIERGTSVSIGVASFTPSDRETASDLALMRTADGALYRAKREGGNRVVAA